MQTFLPYPFFDASVRCLDNKRLGKQRIEAREALYVSNRMLGVDLQAELRLSAKYAAYLWRRYKNHPTAKMWRGYDQALRQYHDFAIEEWVNRRYKNTLTLLANEDVYVVLPWWFGNAAFHAAHRSNLLRKNPAFYGQYGWTEPDDLPYIWPVK